MGSAKRAEGTLRRFALTYPGAYEDFPWGERVIKVAKKIFLTLGVGTDGLHMSVKLPQSATLALGLPFASPTAYNLGRRGWVTARFTPSDDPPLPVLQHWIDESYRAVAPKKLVAGLVAVSLRPPPRSGPRRSKSRLRGKRARSLSRT
jgi:predicted DNA-binding protein (MmcQ/YjbR family)